MANPILLPNQALPVVYSKNWQISWKVEKFLGREADEIAGQVPDEVMVQKGNLLLNDGINLMLKVLTNTHGTLNYYSSGSAYIRVGNSTTAASASQTDLQGASKTSKAMDAGYPTVSAQTATWKSTFGTSDANYAWEEVGVANGSGTPDGTAPRLLNRKVQSFGTKASGSTWTMQLDLTIA